MKKCLEILELCAVGWIEKLRWHMIFVSISHPGLNERNHRANKPRFQTLVLTDTHELFGSRWVLSLRPIRGSSVWKWGAFHEV